MPRLRSAVITLLLFVAFATEAQTSTDTMSDKSANTTSSATDILVEMTTTEGPVTLRLFGDTPRHRDNFVKLASEGYYDGLLFHRVIQDFMVQTGDPESRNARKGQMLGMGDPSYNIPAEIVYPRHFHQRGALAAARQGDNVNPKRESSGSQFYIVTGRRFSSSELDRIEMNLIRNQKQAIVNDLLAQNRDTIMSLRRNRDNAGLQALQDSLQAEARKIADNTLMGFTAEQIEAYTTKGGSPHLDGAYTVFGVVEKGYDVIDRIQQVPVDGNDRPVDDVKIISMKVLGNKE